MAKNHHESKVQQAAVRWFSYQYPELTLYAIPNGGKRNPIEAAIMKLEGVNRGVPDLFLAHAKGPYHGLYIEMKYGDKGKLSPEQVVMIDKLKQENYAVEVARDVMQFIDVVNAYLKL